MPLPPRAPDTTTRAREERSCLHRETSRPHIHPAAPPGQQLSRSHSHFFSSSCETVTDLRFHAQSWFLRTGELPSPCRANQRGKVSKTVRRAISSTCPPPPLPPLSSPPGGEQAIGAMSRKKAVKGKGGSKSPKASPSSSARTGRGLAAAAAPSSGLVYPSRPSISNSGEFYDIAFKVSWVVRLHVTAWRRANGGWERVFNGAAGKAPQVRWLLLKHLKRSEAAFVYLWVHKVKDADTLSSDLRWKSEWKSIFAETKFGVLSYTCKYVCNICM